MCQDPGRHGLDESTTKANPSIHHHHVPTTPRFATFQSRLHGDAALSSRPWTARDSLFADSRLALPRLSLALLLPRHLEHDIRRPAPIVQRDPYKIDLPLPRVNDALILFLSFIFLFHSSLSFTYVIAYRVHIPEFQHTDMRSQQRHDQMAARKRCSRACDM